ncbi:DUF4158 domain-containing protein, partial [Bacillus cereus]|nr:DUF4158 domain-containing protein [Bacillus cereus]
MATREVLTQTQREYFYKLSDQVSERERIRYYTLSEEDIQIIRQQRGATNQLGFAFQLAYLRFPGRPFASGEKIPDFLVSLLAKRLGIVPAAIHNYAKIRDTTRREHISKIRKHFGFRSFTLREYRELANWLLPTAMGTEKGLVLVDLLIQEMRKRKIILPAMYAVEHLVWAVCERAE